MTQLSIFRRIKRFMPHGIVHQIGYAVAEELGLPRWWLNEQANAYISGKDRIGR
jgi:hypothetical protein